jgi:hypothetical protein
VAGVLVMAGLRLPLWLYGAWTAGL